MYKNLEPSRKNIVYLAGRREKLPNTIYPDKTLLIYTSHLLFLRLRYRDMGKEGEHILLFYILYYIPETSTDLSFLHPQCCSSGKDPPPPHTDAGPVVEPWI
jgi:hypothetical protein